MNAPKTLQTIFLLLAVAVMVGCQRQQDLTSQTTSSTSQSSTRDDSRLELNPVSDTKPADNTPAETSPHGTTTQNAAPDGRPSTAMEALEALMVGNQRFVDGQSIHPHESADYRASLANEQHPFATVLTCSDSRVTPVLIFDQGIGDLFVIRVAGNVVDEDETGSMEYAFDHLGAKLLVILGHEDCGAVTAAYHAFVAKDLKQREPHEIESLLMRIEPSLREIDRSKTLKQQIAAGVEANVHLVVQTLLRIPDVQQAQNQGKLKIIGAVYSVSTGRVRLLDM